MAAVEREEGIDDAPAAMSANPATATGQAQGDPVMVVPTSATLVPASSLSLSGFYSVQGQQACPPRDLRPWTTVGSRVT